MRCSPRNPMNTGTSLARPNGGSADLPAMRDDQRRQKPLPDTARWRRTSMPLASGCSRWSTAGTGPPSPIRIADQVFGGGSPPALPPPANQQTGTQMLEPDVTEQLPPSGFRRHHFMDRSIDLPA